MSASPAPTDTSSAAGARAASAAPAPTSQAPITPALITPAQTDPGAALRAADTIAELVARQLLDRTGVVFRKTVMRERIPIPWRDLLRVYRTLELRGEVRGGRFVAGFDGEQYAWPRAVQMLRRVRREGERPPLAVGAADPLNFRGILTPDERVSPLARRRVAVTGEGAN